MERGCSAKKAALDKTAPSCCMLFIYPIKVEGIVNADEGPRKGKKE